MGFLSLESGFELFVKLCLNDKLQGRLKNILSDGLDYVYGFTALGRNKPTAQPIQYRGRLAASRRSSFRVV